MGRWLITYRYRGYYRNPHMEPTGPEYFSETTDMLPSMWLKKHLLEYGDWHPCGPPEGREEKCEFILIYSEGVADDFPDIYENYIDQGID